MSDTVATTEAIERGEQDRADAEMQRKADLQAIIDTPEGRRFLQRLFIDQCHIFDGGGYCSNGSQMYYNSGSRSVGMNIKEQIEALSPQAFLEILQEEVKYGK